MSRATATTRLLAQTRVRGVLRRNSQAVNSLRLWTTVHRSPHHWQHLIRCRTQMHSVLARSLPRKAGDLVHQVRCIAH